MNLINLINFSNLIWDEDCAAFLESIQDSSNTPSKSCVICNFQAIKKKSETPIFNLGSIFYLDTVFHQWDFIYILNEQNEDAPYEIGQILGFFQDNSNNTIQLQIRRLKHDDDFIVSRFFNQGKDEVCVNNFSCSFTYIAILASSLSHITNRNYYC